LIKIDLPVWDNVLDLQPSILPWIFSKILEKVIVLDLPNKIGRPRCFDVARVLEYGIIFWIAVIVISGWSCVFAKQNGRFIDIDCLSRPRDIFI
jgi:hypothetical protein